jgi:hypothetical protein
VIRVSIWKGVPADVAAAVKTACARLPAVSPVRHRLTVKVVPRATIVDAELCPGQFMAGVFMEFGDRDPVIGLAAGGAEIWQMAYKWSRRYAVRRLVFNLCHEVAHY